MSPDLMKAAYQRDAAVVTDWSVPAPGSDEERRPWRRRKGPPSGSEAERALVQAEEVVAACRHSVAALRASLLALAALRRPRLLGKVEDDQAKVEKAAVRLDEAGVALGEGDLGACGRAVRDAQRILSSIGGLLTLALGEELAQVALPRDKQAALEANLERRRELQRVTSADNGSSPRDASLASAAVHQLLAEGLAMAAEILGQWATAPARVPKSKAADAGIRVISPSELETFADVGGLEGAKEHLRRTLGLMLERSAEASEVGVVHNGILLYGPPGTGKTLLARAAAGEYGLRYALFSPAAIASAYQHEPAKKLREVFALAAASTPCLLFLDEIDSIGGKREGVSPDQREIAIQLFSSLEEYRGVPGLVVMAATNALDHLDPALREGRFDSRIPVPLPDAAAREDILRVQLEGRNLSVAWEALDLGEVARMTSGRSGAALAAIITGTVERALTRGEPLSQEDLLAEIAARSGQDRLHLMEDQVPWEDVVLPEATRDQLAEILLTFERPDLARSLGVTPPAGILLHGPPGTGKTTIARALASQVKASFYDHSAADLLSKWVGESEQKVAQLFTRARANRPSIIFLDEIDALLKRRTSDSATPWEERVVSQFLGELDGLKSNDGVLLVGSTNRLDMIDEAVRQRRLVPIEVPLPDEASRARILEVLCREVRLGTDVDLGQIASASEGMSGANLKQLRNSAGMKALVRAAKEGRTDDVSVMQQDFAAALVERGVAMAAPVGKKAAPRKRRVKLDT